MKQPKWRQLALALALAAACAFAGASMSSTNVARGEVRGTPESPAFQTGGQQSVPILREISGTLRQIDLRLARLETVAQKLQGAAVRKAVIAAPATSEDTTDTQ